jgi:hypothetical protein
LKDYAPQYKGALPLRPVTSSSHRASNGAAVSTWNIFRDVHFSQCLQALELGRSPSDFHESNRATTASERLPGVFCPGLVPAPPGPRSVFLRAVTAAASKFSSITPSRRLFSPAFSITYPHLPIERNIALFYDWVVRVSRVEKLRKINLQPDMYFDMMRLAQNIGILPLHAPQIQPTEYNKT